MRHSLSFAIFLAMLSMQVNAPLAQTTVETSRSPTFVDAIDVPMTEDICGDLSISASVAQLADMSRKLIQSGRFADAVPCVRLLQQRVPDNPVYRYDLGRLQLQIGHVLEARRNFESVLKSAASPELLQAADRLARQIDRKRSWDLSASFGISPELNPRRRPDLDSVSIGGIEFDIDQSEQDEIATALQLGVSASWKPNLSDRLRGSFRVNASGRFYDERELDDAKLYFEAGLLLRSERGAETGVGLSFSDRYLGGDPYIESKGAYFTHERELNAKLSLRGRLDVEKLSNLVSPNKTGIKTVARLNFRHVATDRLALDWGIYVGRMEAAAAFERSNEFGLSIDGRGAFPNGLLVSFGVSTSFIRFDERSPLFLAQKSDNYSEIRLGLAHRNFDIFGLVPELQLRAGKGSSTIDFYDFDYAQVGIGFLKKF